MTAGTNIEEAEQLALAAPKVQYYLALIKSDWNSLITDTKSIVFDTVNFPVKVISGLCTDNVCARRRSMPPG